MNDAQHLFCPGTVWASGRKSWPEQGPVADRQIPQGIYRGKVMMKSDSFEILRQHQAWDRQRACHLVKIAQQWDAAIRQGLQDLAQASWRNCHMFGLVPLRRYRLRHQVTPEAQIWWVEHDVPPYDQYWCAAYRVQLTLDDRDEPVLIVKSETAVHPVRPLTVEALNRTLAQTGKELPLLIPRKMGLAKDP